MSFFPDCGDLPGGLGFGESVDLYAVEALRGEGLGDEGDAHARSGEGDSGGKPVNLLDDAGKKSVGGAEI